MGCFNRIGFHSKLPITYGDKIVVFLCETNLAHRNAFPIHINDSLNPLFLPLVGEYNDYGGIENYNKDVAEKIEKVLGVNVKDLIESILRIGDPITLKTISEIENSEDENIRSRYEFDKKEFECCKTALMNIAKYDKYHVRDNCGLCITMERYDVYKKIGSFLDNKESLECFNSLLDIMNKYDMKLNLVCSKTFSYTYYDYCIKLINTITSQEVKRIKDIMTDFMCKFSNDSYSLCYPYDNGMDINDNLSRQIYDFLLFNLQLSLMNGFYSLSSYGNQCVWDESEEFKELNSFYVDIINKEIEKNKEEDF